MPVRSRAGRAIQALARGAVRDALESGKNVIFDDLLVKPDVREALQLLAQESGARVMVIFLDTPVEVVRERQRLVSAKPEKQAQWEAHTQLLPHAARSSRASHGGLRRAGIRPWTSS